MKGESCDGAKPYLQQGVGGRIPGQPIRFQSVQPFTSAKEHLEDLRHLLWTKLIPEETV